MGVVLRRLWGAVRRSRRFRFGSALEAVLRERRFGGRWVGPSEQSGDSTQPERFNSQKTDGMADSFAIRSESEAWARERGVGHDEARNVRTMTFSRKRTQASLTHPTEEVLTQT